LEARKLFEQESLNSKPKPTINGISQEEIDLLKAMQEQPQQPSPDAVSQAELDARKLFEQESLKTKSKPPIEAISQEEIDLLKALEEKPTQPSTESVSQAELEARKLFEQESLNSKPKPTINGISQAELDALKAMEQEPQKPATVNTIDISEQELADLAKMLDQMPAPDPQPKSETSLEEKKLPEWLNELETTDNSIQAASTEAVPAGTPPFFGINENSALPQDLAGQDKTAAPNSEPLPEIDFKLPWEIEETTTVSPPEQPTEPATNPVAEEQAAVILQPVVKAQVEEPQPASVSFAEVLNAVAPQTESIPAPAQAAAEPAAPVVAEPVGEEPTPIPAPPSLKDFRFNYTLVLLPGDHNQFLARNLSEKLSSVMPEIHEDQGWRMTSITVRPQYLLWTVTVPMGVCPHRIIQEVRNLTSNSIFANFPEIAKTKTSNDFWSSKFLAVSGSEPPPANLIFDFVSNAWKNPETDTP
jgi:hypothetical protein